MKAALEKAVAAEREKAAAEIAELKKRLEEPPEQHRFGRSRPVAPRPDMGLGPLLVSCPADYCRAGCRCRAIAAALPGADALPGEDVMPYLCQDPSVDDGLPTAAMPLVLSGCPPDGIGG